MSILIKGMEMPESCIDCKLILYEDGTYVCPFSRIMALNIGRQDDCPLVEVPTPHGRLIDKDAFEKDLAQNVYASKRKTMSYPTVVSNTILKTPIIIEAEE